MTLVKDLPHKLENLCVDRNNIDKLIQMKTARKLHESQVRRIKRLLDDGKHFSAPMVTNGINGGKGPEKNELIDGNNRTEAIRRKIKEDPDFSIEVDFIRYVGLTPQQKADVFDSFNQGIRVSKQDMMVVHQNELPAVRDIIRKYPVQLDVGQGVVDRNFPFVRLSAIVNAHLSARRKYGLNSVPPVRWQLARGLDRKDYEDMVAFGSDLKEFASDQYRQKKMVMKIPTMTIIYRIWYLNCIEMPFMGTVDESRKAFRDRAWDVLHWERVISAFRDANKVGKGDTAVAAERVFVDAVNHNGSFARMKYPNDYYGRSSNEVS